MRELILVALILLSVVAATTSCDNRPTGPQIPGWDYLGPRDVELRTMALDWPYLYAGGYTTGVLAADLSARGVIWERLGLDDRWIEDIEVLPSGRVLVASDAGIERFDPSDSTWHPSGDGTPPCVGGCSVNCMALCNGALYAGTYRHGLYRSDDAGLSWTLVSEDSTLTFRELDCYSAIQGLMMAQGSRTDEIARVFVSRDQGVSWEELSRSALSNEIPITVSVDPSDPARAYVGLLGGVVRTEDGGETWSLIFKPQEYISFSSIAHDPSVLGHLFMAANGTPGNTNTVTGIIYEGLRGGASIEAVETPFTGHILELMYDDSRQDLYVLASTGIHRFKADS